MKKGLYPLLTMTAFALASQAQAAGGRGDGGAPATAATTGLQSSAIHVSAHNPAKCQITASQVTVPLNSDVISDANGFAKSDVGNQVATALNGADIHAWCSGNANLLQVARTSMSLNGIGAGEVEDFSQAVIYDVQATITGVKQRNGGSAYATTTVGDNLVGTIVGALTALQRFGATGDGPQVTFTNDQLAPRSFAVTNAQSGFRSRLAYGTTTTHRLVAGAYQSTVKLTLIPGDI